MANTNKVADLHERILKEISKVVIGKDEILVVLADKTRMRYGSCHHSIWIISSKHSILPRHLPGFADWDFQISVELSCNCMRP